jgi:hypothetical protein
MRGRRCFGLIALFGCFSANWLHRWQHELPSFGVQQVRAAGFLEAECDWFEVNPSQLALPMWNCACSKKA